MRPLFLIILCSLIFGQSSDRGSDIRFSHYVHVADQGIKCTKCHNPKLLKTSMSASDAILPTEERCTKKCHKVWKEKEECDRCHLSTPPFTSFPTVVRNYNFPHKIHFVDEDLECETCHGDMVNIGNFPPIPNMKECLDCHDTRAPLYCDGCHTNVATIRPSNHSITWLKDHDIAASINSSECQTCHIQNACDNCHSGAILSMDSELPTMNPIPSYRPDLFVGKQLLNRNHSLDYVFTHGLDVTFKEKDCSLCHESSNFCSDCHQNNSDI
ncbi:MAG: cytochrome c3 family protein, partial [Bacteroidetes bacterium]|nr:cytochrome c3 family protein [Bacteroidota bacterium]